MTKFSNSSVLSVSALSLLLAVGPSLLAAQTLRTTGGNIGPVRVSPTVQAPVQMMGFAAIGVGPTAADDNSVFCGIGDILVIYDEDENGNRIPGTEVYSCVYD